MSNTFLFNDGEGVRLKVALGLLFFGLVLNQPSLAQTENTEAQSPITKLTQGLYERVSIDVDSFKIVGDNPLSQAKTKSVLAAYLGKDRGIDDIEGAADSLEKAILAAGYSFYRVTFPPQELSDGVVELLVKAYVIGKVSVKGNKHFLESNIVASLPRLQVGQSPTIKSISRALRMANQNGSKRVRLSFAPGSGSNEIDAVISVVDRKPVAVSTWLNNTGSDATGDYRVGFSAAHANLFGRDHNASLSFITSPEGVNEVQQIAASYRIPLYRLGGNLNFIAVRSNVDTGTVAGVFDVAGRGEVYGVGYSHLLASIGSYKHGLSLQLSDKLFDNDIKFQGEQLLEDVRSRPLSLSYQGSWTTRGGVQLSGSLSSTSNLSGGEFNNQRSYALSRIGADDDWNKFVVGLNLQLSRKNWLYSAAAKIAISSDRLITGEQFAVGGTSSLRGLEERELRGDEGYLLNLQAWAPEVAKGLRPVAFLDAGKVRNNDPIEGEIESESVVSVGVLFNWNPIDKITASASYGYLLDGIDDPDPLSTVSRDGDSKVHFNLTYRF